MTEQKIKVDALLATTYNRLLHAGETVNRMRQLNQVNDEIAYWQTAIQLAEHMMVAGHAIAETHRILLAGQGILPKEEEWIQ
jgi:hypothetical protein